MSEIASAHEVPVLRGAWLEPARAASSSLALVLADMVLRPITCVSGLHEIGRAANGQTARAVVGMLISAVPPVVLAERAVKAKTTRGALALCAAAGVLYGLVSGVVSYALLADVVGVSREAGAMMRVFSLGGVALEGVSFPLALGGLVLAARRGGASLDRGHRAMLACGVWLLALATVVFWSAWGAGVTVRLTFSPTSWSLPLMLAGGALIARAALADTALLRWLSSVRAGDTANWRVRSPEGGPDASIPALLGVVDASDLDASLEVESRPVARLFGDDDDRANLRRARRAAVWQPLAGLVLAGVAVFAVVMLIGMGLIPY